MALEISEPDSEGIFGGLMNILTRPRTSLETREAMGAVYGVICTQPPLRPAHWRRVGELAGRYADRLLLPEGLDAPTTLKEAVFPRFERLVLLKTAIEIIAHSQIPMYRRVAALVDGRGIYADFLFPLLHHYTTIRVLTARQDIYEEQAQRMMEELGAPVIICDSYSELLGCVLAIAPEGIDFPDRLSCPVLSYRPPEAQQYSDFITDLRVSPGVELERRCPVGISPHKFMAALYEYCAVSSACRPADTVTWRYRRADIAEVIREIDKI